MSGNRFGAHVSISGGVSKAPQNGLASKCDVVQIFTKNQMQWKVKDLDREEIHKFKQEEERTGVDVVCVHASYLINLAGSDAYKLQRSRMNFLIELERTEALGIPFLVVHPGSHMGMGVQAGVDKVVESLNSIFDKCPESSVKVLLEATAGQGDNIGYDFNHLAEIKDRVIDTFKVGYCLDTCHIFAAGYELRTPEGYGETMQKLDETLGAGNVFIIHANDSKNELGSRLDRHEHIGEGQIGLSAFKNLVNDSRFKEVPFIIETPGDPTQDADNLLKLRDLVKEGSKA